MKTKNLFLSMLAVAGVLFSTSCSKEEVVSNPSSEFVNATFTLGTANGIGTRAEIGMGLKADVVECAVFDAAGEEMENLRQTVNVDMNSTPRTAQYSVRLAKGQNYRVVFFAYTSNSNAYNVENMKSIKILPNQSSNIENRDAFTNFIDIKAEDLTNKSNLENTVILKRPFAQLNLGVDATELADAANAGVVINQSKITVTNVYNAFNAFDNDVADDAVSAPMTFAMNAVPTEKLVVGGAEYTYLALNYLLVGDKGQEKSLTDVEFEWLTADGKTNNPTTHFINIPVQRNYRTNIIGKLLTTPTVYNIEIDADFETADGYIEEIETVINKTVNSAAELQAAIDAAPVGQTRIVLGSVLYGNFVVNQKKDVHILIDGQNNMFSGTFVVNGGSQWGGIEGLSLQNIRFMGNYNVDTDVITVGENSSTSRYAHNVTVTNCSFQGGGSNLANSVVIRAYQANDLTVNDCDVIGGFHSIAQITGGGNIKFEKVTSNSSLRGISLGSATDVLISNCNIKAAGDEKYGIRHNADYATAGLKIVETKVDAYFPVVVRCTNGAAQNYTLTFEGNNTLVKNAASEYHVAIAMEEYDAVGKTLTALSNATVTGADAAWTIFK